jgi:DUF1680 family protein
MRIFYIFLLLSTPLLALIPQPKAEDKIQDKWVPIGYDSQHIGGYLAERLKVNLEERLLKVDEPALLAGFRSRPGKQEWIGEHAGKYLDAAANTWQYTGDSRLKVQMDRIAAELIKTQMADGYLGTYIEKDRWTSWDVWVHKYDLLGLLAYYRVTGDDTALTASRKIGDLLVRTFGEGKRDIITSSTHVGMAATSVLEPMCLLYRYTGEQRYLDFALYITRAWEQANGPKLISSLTTQGSVFKTANAKAYEMMSDLVGLVELYRLTGEPKFLLAATNAWKDIQTNRLYVTGTTSSSEHFTDDGVLPGEEKDNVGEGCATVTWLQLTWQLLRIANEPKYADELERTVYNQLLAAQDPHNGNICYFTPMNGKKKPGPGINCCVSSEPRGISMIPELAWGTANGGPVINFFVPGHFTTGAVSIESVTNFPRDGVVSYTVKIDQPTKFPVSIRIPGWTGGVRMRAAGKKVSGKPGTYVVIDRVWKHNDVIEVEMDMNVRALDGGKSYPGFVAIQRGVQILALDRSRNPELTDLSKVTLNPGALLLRPSGDDYAVESTTGPVILTPFADAVDYRIWLRKK